MSVLYEQLDHAVRCCHVDPFTGFRHAPELPVTAEQPQPVLGKDSPQDARVQNGAATVLEAAGRRGLRWHGGNGEQRKKCRGDDGKSGGDDDQGATHLGCSGRRAPIDTINSRP
ncbi:hypothetical protein [Bradyrhizobium sp. SZCCHNR1015]|uniref:hypothetical protein n=1 Tax=Bradyrhizobium sp. SZCCHNR1015 TaxID=3057338 RepID=UPI002916E5E6|nr:hypothetical protein [Bradyrhizobium sp. SZCCHNR1015]